MLFTVEELTLLDIYRANDIEHTKEAISKALPNIDDKDMINLANSVILKLNKLTANEFNNLDFTNVLSHENVDTDE
ncbi:MAG: conjugal transfer protein [Clostridiaceae bacterium]|nr:conjugal transfer protein [Clostridiaceae bacterium]